MVPSDANDRFVEGLTRALDAFVAGRTGPPTKLAGDVGGHSCRRVRRPGLPEVPVTPEMRMHELIRQELGEGWVEIARAAAVANGAGERARRLGHWFVTAGFPKDLVALVIREGDSPDTRAIAKRMAGYVCGAPLAPWQYVGVDVVPAYPAVLLDGWELAPVDPRRDPTLPINFGCDVGPLGPAELHELYQHGVLRRPSRDDDVVGWDEADERRVLVWPLIALNLATDFPVHASLGYYVEPGREVVDSPHGSAGCYQHFVPKERAQWEHVDPVALPQKGRLLDEPETGHLAVFCRAVGRRLEMLDDRRRRQFIRAADQYLTVCVRTSTPHGNGYRDGAALPVMHGPEAVFRWVAAIEGLVAGEDRDHTDLARKVAQRTALLLGHDDEERIAVRDIVKTAYRARSSFAHGIRSEGG